MRTDQVTSTSTNTAPLRDHCASRTVVLLAAPGNAKLAPLLEALPLTYAAAIFEPPAPPCRRLWYSVKDVLAGEMVAL